ncbi:cytosine permease [Faecalicatena orotica]|uniref:cytosine permease n=1 Tax=Faecalicatena orotica TaxID=1544 RepID=UPI00321799C6
MSKNQQVNTAVENPSEEYATSAVPQSKRRGFFGLMMVWMGYVFVVTTMQVGGTMARGLTFSQFISAALLAGVMLAVIACFMAYISCKEGLTFTLLCRYSFGKAGIWIPVFLIVITCVSWFSIDAWLIGATVNTLFPSIPIIPVVIIAAICIIATALVGIRAMTILSNIAVPLIFIFGIISIVFSFKSVGVEQLMEVTPDASLAIPFSMALALGVGSFSHGAVANTAEVMRFSKSPKQAIITMIIAMMVGNTFMLLFGGIGMLSTGEYDMAMILKAQNLLAPAFLVVLLNIWSTAQGLVYASANAIAATLKVKRLYICIGIGIVGLTMALLHFIDYFGTWIDLNAKFIPPFAGIIIADYFFIYKRKFPDVLKFEKIMPTVNWAGLLTWLTGSVLAGFRVLEFGLPTMNYIVVCVIVKIILSKYVFKQEEKSVEECAAD